MALQFTKAERKQAKLRLAISGPSGSGKTYGALLLAQGISDRIAVVDTERGSASLYSHMASFDVLDLSAPYTPERYIEALQAGAAHVGPNGVLIIDSLSHEWIGSGGCLEINEAVAKAKYRGNTWSAWAETGARHAKLLEAIIGAPCHIIATLRSKTETAQTEENGKKKVIKVGMKSETRDGAEYEFTTVLDIIHDGHYATATKDRTGLFSGSDPKPITKATGATLKKWLASGAAIKEPVPDPEPEDVQPIDEPEAMPDNLELIELDMGDVENGDQARDLYRRLLMFKRNNPSADGGKMESLRQQLTALGASFAEKDAA